MKLKDEAQRWYQDICIGYLYNNDDNLSWEEYLYRRTHYDKPKKENLVDDPSWDIPPYHLNDDLFK